MTKQFFLVGALVVTLGAGPAVAQGPAAGQGHTAPKAQPTTAPAPTVPAGEMPLGSIRLSKAVTADGRRLAAGTYQVRLTAQTATPDAKGQTAAAERWVEFVQRGQVKGREVVTVISQAEIGQVQKDAPPSMNASKVEMLKGDDYVRVWINRGGTHYLIHLPPA